MAQIADIEARLDAPGAPRLTAADLGVAADRLPGSAVLTRVWWEGAPEFPYIHGDFAGAQGASGAPGSVVAVPLHTPQLVKISHDLGLRHRWGV